MLQQFITSFATRSGIKPATRLQPGELQELLESVPEVASKLRIRQLRLVPSAPQPRSVCTSLKDLCEL